MRTFQVVLRDGGFGEELCAVTSPTSWDHVVASVQSLHEERLASIPPDHFDVVIEATGRGSRPTRCASTAARCPGERLEPMVE
jgi:hypothetical protein